MTIKKIRETNGTDHFLAAKYDDSGNVIVNTYETKTDAAAKLTEAKTYADGIKNSLLNGAGAAYDTLKELGDLITANDTAIDALETVAAGKADKTHSHTNYASTVTTTGTGNAITAISQSGNTITATKGATFLTSLPSHSHDDKYYTEEEINTKLSSKAGTSTATTSANGLMSAADKKKLDEIEPGANKTSVSTYTDTGTKIATIEGKDLYAPNTHRQGKNVIGYATSTEDASDPPNYDVYLNHVENNTITSSHCIKGSGATSVKMDTEGNIIISSTDTDTTYDKATTSKNGLMSFTDKSKLDSIEYNANNYTHPSYEKKNGVLNTTQEPGFGGTFSISETNSSDGTGHVTSITQKTVKIPDILATSNIAGLMSADDKKKLNGIAEGANNYTYTLPTASSSLGGVKTTSTVTSTSGLTACPIISGVPYYKDTNTTYTHPASGVTAGTYNKVTVDANGHVTAGSNPATLSEYGITDAYTKTTTDSLLNGKSNTSHTHSSLKNNIGAGGEVQLVRLVYSNTNGTRDIYRLIPADGTEARIAGFSQIEGDKLTANNSLNVGGTASITGITTVQARIQPNKDNNVNLGYSDNRWMNVYCAKSSLSTSDLNQKKNLRAIDDKYMELFDLVQPYAYHFIDGDRTHTGFIAQYVEEAMEKVGLSADDLGFFCKDIKHEILYDENGNYIGEEEVYDEDGNPVYVYSLRYEEYIAIVTEKVKRMEKRINELEAKQEKLNTLEKEMVEIKSLLKSNNS